MTIDISLRELWFNQSLLNHFFRSQAQDTLEELMDLTGATGDEDMFNQIEDIVDSYYSDLDDFEEECYNNSAEDLAEFLGIEIQEDEDEQEIDGCGLVSYLDARYDSRASFYNKAVIDDHDDAITLYSYNTEVAKYDKRTGILHVYGWYSSTTARHIREFARQLGIILPKGSDIKGEYQV